MSGSKPLELIIANVTHELVEDMGDKKNLGNVIANIFKDKAPPEIRDKMEAQRKCAATESFARNLLCSISHNAALPVVLKALAAMGAPAAEDEIWARLESAREAQRREAGEQPQANS